MEVVLTKALRRCLEDLPPEAREDVLAAVLRQAWAIQALPAGSARARTVHARVDAATAPFAALRPEALKAVRCRKGCAHCCRIRVDVTADEAELLAELVRAGAAHPDPSRLALQRDWATPEAFVGRPRVEAECVFLGEDGACTVYEDRPSACRALLVASDPELCRDAGAGTRITAVLNPYLEVVVSAAQTVAGWEGRGGSWMAAALAEALS